jgi:mRNA interferase MazF
MYLVKKPGARKEDPRRQRVFVVVSRQTLIEARFSTVIYAPVYSRLDGLSSQVAAGEAEGLKQDSSIHCDGLVGPSTAGRAGWGFAYRSGAGLTISLRPRAR